MDSFKSFLEATAMQTDIGSGMDVINNDGRDDDDDEWDCDKIRKKYWDALLPWVRTSQAANVVRFNIYSVMIKKMPKAKSMLWGPQGDLSKRKILKARTGYARVDLQWTLPMEGMLWDKLVEQQRAVLSKSDLYKVFAEAGKVGSAALLFKGEVLECIVYLCCALIPTNNPFTTNIIKLAKVNLGTKIEEWLKTRIVEKLNGAVLVRDLKLVEMRNSGGLCQAYLGDLILKFDQTFRMSF